MMLTVVRSTSFCCAVLDFQSQRWTQRVGDATPAVPERADLPHDGPSDADIVGRVLGGDSNAYETLVHRYSRLVFGIVGKHAPRDRVDEVAQDVFVEGFRSLGSFSQKGPFGHWLAKVAVRCCYNFWRQRHRKGEIPFGDLTDQSVEWMDTVLSTQSREAFDRAAASAEAREVLDHALGRLAPEDRMVVTLVHLDGLSVKEAAALLGWSTVSVKVRAHRSRKKLRQIILQVFGEGTEEDEVTDEESHETR